MGGSPSISNGEPTPMKGEVLTNWNASILKGWFFSKFVTFRLTHRQSATRQRESVITEIIITVGLLFAKFS